MSKTDQPMPKMTSPEILPNLCGPEAKVDFLAEAQVLGARFLREAKETSDGGLYWMKPVANAEGKFVSMGPHLHAGFAGIALFLAALGKVSGDAAFIKAALSSLRPLCRQLREMRRQPETFELKLGAVAGLSSLIYALLRVGTWLDEPTLIEEACDAAALITPDKVAADKYCDFMYGTAGALHVLLLLDQEVPETLRSRIQPLQRAICCGEHLLKQKIPSTDEPTGWPSPLQPPSCGFAHGASGIALALGRLAWRTRREDFWTAAMEGLAFERLHYDPQIDNWLTLRFHKHKLILNAWCNGAAGIALARLGLLQQRRHQMNFQDLQMALDSICRVSQANIDTMCCGNFGRADILLEASLSLNRQDLRLKAEQIATIAVLEARGNSGAYRTNVPGKTTGGLYTGLSGIGYSLLRLAGAKLPCLLAAT